MPLPPPHLLPIFLRNPVYGPSRTFSGTSMEVVIGPGNNLMYLGSPSSSASIPAIMGPLHTRDRDKWVAGHLLAGEMGGSGTDPHNLTPITHSANKRMSSRYELKVKAMGIKCRQYMTLSSATDWVSSGFLGVKYRVDVSNESFGDFAPYDRVASHLTLSARVFQFVPAGPGRVIEQPLTAHINNYFCQDYFANGRIDNDDSDLV